MPTAEFSLIYQQIAPLAGHRADVLLGIGDDAAIVQPKVGESVVVAVDTLVAGRHFFSDCAPEDIAWKALAVNLSDLAAMGALPQWALLSLSLPENLATSEWLSRFMCGWREISVPHNVALIGGDTTRSDCLTISVTLMGSVPLGQSIQRSGAAVGDDLWLSGRIGDAGLAITQLYAQQQPMTVVAERLHRPQPRVALGLALRGMASAALDISDGFLADLGHLLKASGGLGAECFLDDFPFSSAVHQWVEQQADPFLPLTSGDDYELLFTAPPSQRQRIILLSQQLVLPLTRVGHITPMGSGVQLCKNHQVLVNPLRQGFDHFAATDIMKSS